MTECLSHDCGGKAGSQISGKFSGLHSLDYVDSYEGSCRGFRRISLDREMSGRWLYIFESTTSCDDDAVALGSRNSSES